MVSFKLQCTICDETMKFTSHMCHEPQLFVGKNTIFSCSESCDYADCDTRVIMGAAV